MRSLYLIFLSITFLVFSPQSMALDGIPESMVANGKNLVLNGAGSRTKFVVTVYNAGLYLQAKSEDAARIIAANEPMAIRMKIKSGFASKDKIKSSLMAGFQNSTGGNIAPIQEQINQLLGSAFKDEIAKNDVFDLVYTPGAGTKVLKNNKNVTVVQGLAIKQALFGIWLSEKPAQSSLKAQLLGKEF